MKRKFVTGKELLAVVKNATHSNFKHYTKMEYIQNMFDKQCMYFGNGENWNDKVDANSMNDNSFHSVKYGLCLSCSTLENVAMWIMYGRDYNKNGGMINFSNSMIKEIVESVKRDGFVLGNLVDNCFIPEKTINAESDFDVYTMDIVYGDNQKLNDTMKRLRRMDEIYDVAEKDLSEVDILDKTYPWHYEKECRLLIKITDSKILKWLQNNKCAVASVSLPNHVVRKMKYKLVKGPNYDSSFPCDKHAKKSEIKQLNWNV